MSNTIVECPPGSGKTIIASHRAAYMVNSETLPENTLDGRVLVVGPTDGYSAHVRDVIGTLVQEPGRVLVLSLPELMQKILGLRLLPSGEMSTNWQDADWKLGMYARSAVKRLIRITGETPTTKQAYEELRRSTGALRTSDENSMWLDYLRRLPKFEEAVTRRRHVPLLSIIRREVAPAADLDLIEHIVVDEAQDLTPLEWFLLQELNQAHAWTLLGDLNQRRSDHSLSNWDQVLEILAVDTDDTTNPADSRAGVTADVG